MTNFLRSIRLRSRPLRSWLRRGFSLAETVLVTAVAAAALVGVVFTYNTVTSGNNARKTVDDLKSLVLAVHPLAHRGSFAGLTERRVIASAGLPAHLHTPTDLVLGPSAISAHVGPGDAAHAAAIEYVGTSTAAGTFTAGSWGARNFWLAVGGNFTQMDDAMCRALLGAQLPGLMAVVIHNQTIADELVVGDAPNMLALAPANTDSINVTSLTPAENSFGWAFRSTAVGGSVADRVSADIDQVCVAYVVTERPVVTYLFRGV